MKRGMALLLLVSILAVLALWAISSPYGPGDWHDGPGSASSAGTTVQADTGDAVTAQPRLSSIKPRPANTDRSNGLTRDDYTAAFEAREAEHPLDALRELAEAGNSVAAKDLGDRLIRCRPGALQDADDKVGRLVTQLSWARRELGVAKDASSPAGTLETLAQRVESLERQVAADETSADLARARCRDLTPEQTWQGFEWLDRAVAMGYAPAMDSFIRTVRRTFYKPGAVGRNPRKAMELRDRARNYLARIMQECDQSRLWLYAWSMPTLYRLSDEQRLAAGQIAMHAIEISQSDSAYVERMKHRLEIDELRSRLSASQIASAKRQAADVRSRCLGSGAP